MNESGIKSSQEITLFWSCTIEWGLISHNNDSSTRKFPARPGENQWTSSMCHQLPVPLPYQLNHLCVHSQPTSKQSLHAFTSYPTNPTNHQQYSCCTPSFSLLSVLFHLAFLPPSGLRERCLRAAGKQVCEVTAHGQKIFH